MNLDEEAVESSAQGRRDEFLEVLRKLIHKLSQPLTCLRGSLEVALLGEMDEDECRRVLAQLLEEAHRMARSLENLRAVLEAEDPGKDFQPLRWGRLVMKVLQEVAPLARRERLRLNFESRVDADVMVNPPRAEAALRQLFERVIRSGPRKRTINIQLSVQENTASLSICDDGPASKRGARARKTTPLVGVTGPGGQTQLDWWILRHAVESQGGRLEIEKTSRRGVCCRVYLPLASSEAAGSNSA